MARGAGAWAGRAGGLEAPGGKRTGLLRLGCGRRRGVLLPIFRTGDRDQFFAEVFHALGDIFCLGPDPGRVASETAHTLADSSKTGAAGVTAVPAPFAKLAADLSRRVPDFHCAAGDASGRVPGVRRRGVRRRSDPGLAVHLQGR